MFLNRTMAVTLWAAALLLGPACDGETPADAGEHEHEHGDAGEHHHDGDAGEHGHGDAGEVTLDGGVSDEATAYCNCVFLSCHDDYHAKWGEDELESRAACLTEADALAPGAEGSEMGDNLSCRQHFCDAAPTDCAAALGGAPCTE